MLNLNNISGRAVARINIGSIVISTSPGTGTYVSGTYLRDADGWSIYHHVLKFIGENDYDTAMVNLSTNRRITFQSGTDAGGSVTWSPAQTQVLISYKATADNTSITGTGFTVIVTTSDLLYTGAIWWRTRSWRGTADKIVALVGTSLGLTPKVQMASMTDLTLLQCYEPCLDFMRRVINLYLFGQGANDVTVAAHADTLMVGSAGWGQWPRYQVNYPGIGVANLEHLDHEHDLRFPGCRTVTGLQYNPLTGEMKNVKVSTDTAVTRLGAFDPPGDPDAIFTMGRHSLPISTSGITNFWSRAYAEANLNQLGVALTVTGPDYLLAGSLILINTAIVNDPFAGLYQVSQVYTELAGGEAKSRLTMRRGNFNAAQVTASGVSPEAEASNQSPTATPGNVVKSVSPNGR